MAACRPCSPIHKRKIANHEKLATKTYTVRQRIKGGRVESAADEHELGAKGVQRGHNHARDRRVVAPNARAGRYRNVDVIALPSALANLREMAAISREHTVLVDRDEEHARVVVECLLRTIAVVHVPATRAWPQEQQSKAKNARRNA